MSTLRGLENNFSPVHDFIFLVGFGDSKNGMDLNVIRQVLILFLKHLQEEPVRMNVVIMQYVEEGVRKVFHSEQIDEDSISNIQLETQGNPTSPFEALDKTLQWIEERKKYYHSQGQSYYPFQIICFPNLYGESNENYEDFNRVLLKLMEMRSSIVISAFQASFSKNGCMLSKLGRENKTPFLANYLYQNLEYDLSFRYNDRLSLEDHSLFAAYGILDFLTGLNILKATIAFDESDWMLTFSV